MQKNTFKLLKNHRSSHRIVTDKLGGGNDVMSAEVQIGTVFYVNVCCLLECF